MRKIILLLLVLTAFLLPVACSDGADNTTGGNGAECPESTTAAVTTKPEGKLEETDAYTAVLNEAKWENTTGVDASAFDYFGAAGDVSNKISAEYQSKTRQWQVITESGEAVATKYVDVKKLGLIGAKVEEKENNVVLISVTEVEMQVQPSWKSVTARAGAYLMFEFKASLPVEFYITVTKEKGGSVSTAAYKQDEIKVKKTANGVYTGIAKCTVPYAEGKTFYINIGINDGKTVVSSLPVSITKAKYDSPYRLIFQGAWDEIVHKTYVDELTDLFYTVYPRLAARWGGGTEHKEIIFSAEHDAGVAYNLGNKVAVDIDFANGSGEVDFFVHEMTHAVQQFNHMIYSGGWFTEAMADLGKFRYYHWGYVDDYDYIKIYEMDDDAIRNFKWEPYDQHNIFMSYLDWKYPTTLNADGTKNLGLVDYIVFNERKATGTIDDNASQKGSIFNNWVKDITGLDTMESVRQQFIRELNNGTFNFTGFGDYRDNFLVEDLPTIPNPGYPKREPAKMIAPSHAALKDPITEGDNLCLTATVVRASSLSGQYAAENMLDGKLDTRYQAGKNAKLYYLKKCYDEIVIDLGSIKTFDTYTMYSKSAAALSLKSWEILISEDGQTFSAVDGQKEVSDSILSVDIGKQSARYVMIRVYEAGNGGITRINEVMLFNRTA